MSTFFIQFVVLIFLQTESHIILKFSKSRTQFYLFYDPNALQNGLKYNR